MLRDNRRGMEGDTVIREGLSGWLVETSKENVGPRFSERPKGGREISGEGEGEQAAHELF